MIKNNITPEAIVAVAKSGVLMGVDEELVAQLKPSHVAVTCSLLHYGKGERNPLDEVTFYSKKKPHGACLPPPFLYRCGRALTRATECAKADYSDISLLMPSSFAEVWLRIYTKDGMFHGLIQAAYRHILKGLVSSEGLPTATEEEPEEEGFDPAVLGGTPLVMVAAPPPDAATEVEAGTRTEARPDAEGGDGDLDVQPIFKVWKPGSPSHADGPSTPRMTARNVSTSSVGSAAGTGTAAGGRSRSRQFGRTPSFSENQFTAVPPNFRSESPSRKPRSKRGRDVSESFDGGRPKKTARLEDKVGSGSGSGS